VLTKEILLMQTPHPTLYADVNALLQTLLERVQVILGDHFIGMYLDGSLTNDAFDQASDIDFIVVTDDQVAGDLFLALQAMHEQIATMNARWGIQLEGSYISQPALRRYDPTQALHPNIERGTGERLKMVHHDAAWVIHRSIVRERGITLAGPAPHTLIDPISPADVQQAMRSMLPGWAASLLQNPAQLAYRGYQSYVVLTLCRVRHTLHAGTIVSKQVAARWAQEALDARWQALIERALAGRHAPDSEASAADINGTLELIRDTLKRSQQYE
jgi:hypothetical protein